jgi:MoxR-like ATPase
MAVLELKRPIIAQLFQAKKPVDGFPVLHGGDEIAASARRHKGKGKATLSAPICKAVIAAVSGHVSLMRAESDGRLEVRTRSTSGTNEYRLGLDQRNTWYSPNGVTYHIPLIALAEAAAYPDAARDLLAAYLDLITYTGGALPDPSVKAGDGTLVRLVAWVSDELYYQLRYREASPTSANDRLEQAKVETSDPGSLPASLPNLAELLVNPKKLKDHMAGRSLVSGGVPAPVRSIPVKGTFRGWQLPALAQALQANENCLLTGTTGTGKSHCVADAMLTLGYPYESVEGKEGLLDLDFLGGIVPQADGSRVWKDGPLARAIRRANETGQKVVFFLDELTRLPQKHANLLIGLLNPKDREALKLMGIEPALEAESYYIVEIPQTAERLAVPTHVFGVVASANLGRQYAVCGIDPALDRRFTTQLEFCFLPAKEEIMLLVERTGIPEAWARILEIVAGSTRQRYKDAQLPGEVDPASLLAWAEKLKREMDGQGDDRLLDALQYTARITWMPRVAGRDHRGLLLEENVATLQQDIEAAVAGHHGTGTGGGRPWSAPPLPKCNPVCAGGTGRGPASAWNAGSSRSSLAGGTIR